MSEVMDAPDVEGLLPQRACRACVQIKAKCIPRQGLDMRICERCARLNKKCMTPAPQSRKRQKRNQTRIAQLEDKITNLTELVTAAQQSKPDSQVPSIPTPISQSSSSHPEELSTILPRSSVLPLASWAGQPVSDIVVDEPDPQDTFQFQQRLDADQEEELFSHFRGDMAHHFPFTKIAPHVTTAKYKVVRPFHFRSCIVAANNGRASQQRAMAQDLLRYIGNNMLLRGEKSLDLLLGLLVLVTWYHFNYTSNPQLMNLLHLALALHVDLGLNRPQHGRERLGMLNDTAQLIHGCKVMDGLRVSEERRALLGLYYLSSTVGFCFAKIDVMPFTDHMEECLKFLEHEMEYPSDAHLVQLIRLRRIMGKYVQAETPNLPLQMPIKVYMKCVEDEIKDFQNSLKSAHVQDAILQVQIQNTLVCMYEPIHRIDTENTVDKLNALYRCLDAVKALFDSFAALPVSSLPNLPFLYWIYVGHGLITIAKLSFFNMSGWDISAASPSANFSSICNQIIGVFQKAQDYEQQSGQAENAYRFGLYAEKIRLCDRWYRARVESESQLANAAGRHGADSDDQIASGLFDGFDDNFWKDLMGDFSFLTEQYSG